MTTIREKREKMEAAVLKTIQRMDPSGYNTNYYKTQVFGKMSDRMFADWIESIRRGESVIFMYCPNMKVNLKPKDILAAAEGIGLPMFEQVKMWDSATGRYYTTPQKYLILRVPVRRLKQYLMDKISIPESDRRINPTTGQVTKPDKGSSLSMVQAQTLDSKGFTNCLIELTNARGGDPRAYAGLVASLKETGSASLAELDLSEGVRSQQTAKAIFQSLHFETNL